MSTPGYKTILIMLTMDLNVFHGVWNRLAYSILML